VVLEEACRVSHASPVGSDSRLVVCWPGWQGRQGHARAAGQPRATAMINSSADTPCVSACRIAASTRL
jgi:hypothetical protein